MLARTPSGSNVLYWVLQGQGGREEPPKESTSGQVPFAPGPEKRLGPAPAPPSPTQRETARRLTPPRTGSEGGGGPGKRDRARPLKRSQRGGHSPEFKQQRLLQAQQGCAHRQQEDGSAKEDVQWAVAGPQRKRSPREQEEAKAHQPLEGKAGWCWGRCWPPSDQPRDVRAACKSLHPPWVSSVLRAVTGEARSTCGKGPGLGT